MKAVYHYEDLNVDGRITLKWISQKYDGVQSGFMWLRTGASGMFL
jgi:hypothetical protein